MIITETIEIKVNPANLKKLRKFLPNVKAYEIITIPISYLTKTSQIKVNVKCDVCNRIVTTTYRGYNKSISNGGYYSCSQKCSKQKGVETNLKKYGVDNPSKSQLVKDKIKSSFQDKYGVDNISFLPEIKAKIKKKVNETYSANIENIKNKQRCSNLKKYGVEDINKEKWFKEEIKVRNINKYGVDNPMKIDEVKERFKNTNLIKYGFVSAFQSDDIKNKIKKTNLERYGVAIYASIKGN